MKPSTVVQCRAHLFVGAIAAVLIQIVVVGSIALFGVPQGVFLSLEFRVAVIAAIIAAVLLARWLAAESFRIALARNDISFAAQEPCAVTLSSECPRRALVMLHVLLNPRQFDPSISLSQAAAKQKPHRFSIPSQSSLERKPAMSRGGTRT